MACGVVWCGVVWCGVVWCVCAEADGKPIGWTGVENVDILAFELASNVQVRVSPPASLFILPS